MTRDDEFSHYVAARWPRLVRAAVLMGCTESQAEDVTQAALERCLLKWHKVRAADDLDAYVHRVLVNTLISSRRRRSARELPRADFPDIPSPDETGAIDDTDAVMRALTGLSHEQRTAVVLRYYAHLDEAQMATALGVPAGTVKSRLSRALRQLRADPNLTELRDLR